MEANVISNYYYMEVVTTGQYYILEVKKLFQGQNSE